VFIRSRLDVSLADSYVPLCRELKRANDVRLLAGYKHRRPDQGLGRSVCWIPSVPIPLLNFLVFSILSAFALPLQIRKFRPDVVLFEPGTAVASFGPALRARMDRRYPRFILDVRTLPIAQDKPLREALERAYFRAAVWISLRVAAGCTVLTIPLGNELATLWGRRQPRVGVWSSGVDATVFDPNAYPPSSPHVELRLVYHGAVLAARGVLQLVDAVAIARERDVAVTLVILGSGPDEAAVQAHIASHGLEDAIQLRAPVPRELVPGILSQADIGVLPFPDRPSWRTSSPLKLMEYLSMGMPVVATELPCHRTVVGDAPFAVYARSSEPGDLAQAIESAYLRRAELLSFASLARELACNSLTWAHQTAAFEHFASALLRSQGRSRPTSSGEGNAQDAALVHPSREVRSSPRSRSRLGKP
jgi:glycosyltransferase involved in cell wall biosynthesis